MLQTKGELGDDWAVVCNDYSDLIDDAIKVHDFAREAEDEVEFPADRARLMAEAGKASSLIAELRLMQHDLSMRGDTKNEMVALADELGVAVAPQLRWEDVPEPPKLTDVEHRDAELLVDAWSWARKLGDPGDQAKMIAECTKAIRRLAQTRRLRLLPASVEARSALVARVAHALKRKYARAPDRDRAPCREGRTPPAWRR